MTRTMCEDLDIHDDCHDAWMHDALHANCKVLIKKEKIKKYADGNKTYRTRAIKSRGLFKILEFSMRLDNERGLFSKAAYFL